MTEMIRIRIDEIKVRLRRDDASGNESMVQYWYGCLDSLYACLILLEQAKPQWPSVNRQFDDLDYAKEWEPKK